MNTMLFIASLIFQVSGGIILLLKNIKLSHKQIGAEYCAGNIIIEFDGAIENIKVEPKRLEGILSNMFLNRIAFIYLIAGYGLSVFGDLEMFNKIVAAILIIIISIIVSYVSFNITIKISKKRASAKKYADIIRDNIVHNTISVEEY